MPAFKPISSGDECFRGRGQTPRCLFRNLSPRKEGGEAVGNVNNNLQIFKEEWFASNLDADEDNEAGNGAKCACGQTMHPTRSEPGLSPVSAKMESYPPYIRISGQGNILAKGTTCQFIMQLQEDDIPTAEIARGLARRFRTETYSPIEVKLIIQACSLLGLNGHSPSASKSWENEPIEGWWFKEDSYCEALRREKPVSKEVCGYDCDNGWWKGRQSGEHRDWERWGYREIGPEDWRRQQCRLYDL